MKLQESFEVSCFYNTISGFSDLFHIAEYSTYDNLLVLKYPKHSFVRERLDDMKLDTYFFKDISRMNDNFYLKVHDNYTVVRILKNIFNIINAGSSVIELIHHKRNDSVYYNIVKVLFYIVKNKINAAQRGWHSDVKSVKLDMNEITITEIVKTSLLEFIKHLHYSFKLDMFSEKEINGYLELTGINYKIEKGDVDSKIILTAKTSANLEKLYELITSGDEESKELVRNYNRKNEVKIKKDV